MRIWSAAGVVTAVGAVGLAVAAPPPATDPAALSATVRVLASDRFEGRAPGTPGEARTVDYLVERLKSLGLEPGAPGGGWTQPVPLVRTKVGEGHVSIAFGKGEELLPAQGKDIYVNMVRPVDRVGVPPGMHGSQIT